ncbi:MAG: hypothetical protein HZA78_06515 [Candidatus Schekmanbacteria bacterium]|nr:hypothetical protein [Candidatus Schekmanbacteria bacterium]
MPDEDLGLDMSEVGILEVIQEQIGLAREKILQAASQQANEILQKAEFEVKRLNEVIAEKKKIQAKTTQIKCVSPLVLNVKQEGMTQVFDSALKELNNLRSQPNYAQVLEKLMAEAYSGFTGTVDIFVNPADVAAAKSIAAKLNIAGNVQAKDSIIAGVSISQNDLVANHNTFASRISKVRIMLSGKVAGVLYV